MYMPTKKNRLSKNKTSKRHASKQSKKVYFIGGTCTACGGHLVSQKMSGGSRRKRGGGYGNDNPPSFQGLQHRYYYQLNDFNNDPSYPPTVISTRTMPNMQGGKKNKKSRSKKGGSGPLGFSYVNSQLGPIVDFNVANSIGNIPASSIGANILAGNVGAQVLPNPSILSQPINSTYNEHNLPMV